MAGVKIVRILLIVVGVLSVVLGVIGMLLPVLPTTPFLLLSAWCFLRSSQKMHSWLLSNRLFGNYLRNYQEGRGIPLRIKVLAISTLWVTILTSVFLFVPDRLWWVSIVMVLIASAVTIHIVRIRPFP